MPALNFKRNRQYRAILSNTNVSKEIDLQTMVATSYASSGGGSLMTATTSDGVYFIKADGAKIHFYNTNNMTTPFLTGSIVVNYGMVISPNGQKLGINTGSENTAIYNLAPIYKSTPTLPTLLGNTSTQGVGSVYGAAFTSDSTKYLSPNPSHTALYIVNSSNAVYISGVALGFGPYDVCVNSAGTKAYVSGTSYASVAVVNLSNNTVSKTISTSWYGRQIKMTPDEKKVVVAYYQNAASAAGTQIGIIDTTTDTVSATVTINGGGGSMPVGLSISPDGKYVLVALSGGSGGGAIVDLTTNTVKGYITGIGAMMNADWIIR